MLNSFKENWIHPSFMVLAVLLGVGFFLLEKPVQSSSHCVNPSDDLNISTNTTLCSGTYTLSDAGAGGIIRITSSNVTVTCEDNTIIRSSSDGSQWTGISIDGGSSGFTNVTVQNCRIENFGNDITAGNTDRLTIQNNTFVFTGPTGSEGKGLQLSANDRAVDTITISDNTFTGTGNGMSFSPVNTATNVRIENNTFSSSIDNVILSANGNTATRFTLSGNTYTSGGGEIIGLHDSTGGIIENETMQNGLTSNLLVRNSHSVTVRNNQLVSANIQIEGSNSGTYEQNFIGGGLNVTSASSNNTITNNIVATSANWSFRISDSTNNAVRNNTFHGGMNVGVLLEGDSTGNNLKNNLVAGVRTGSPIISVSSGSTIAFSSDYNLYDAVDHTFSGSWAGTTTSSLAAWQTASTQDTNSQTGNPLLTDPTNNDFTLQVTSPAIDAGDPESSTPTNDYANATRPYSSGRWDVGAYETSTPVTTNVSLSGTSSHSESDGYTITINITDTSSNPSQTKYAIYESTTGQYLQSDGSGGASPVYRASTSWTHTGLTPDTNYSYDVRATNNEETTITSLKGDPITVRTVLLAPTDLELSAPAVNGFSASWTAPSGNVTTYDLFYGITSTANDAVITGISSTSRRLTGLNPNTRYYVKVRANSAAGIGADSSVSNIVTLPSAPTDFAISDVARSRMTLSWTKPSGTIRSYDVSYGETPNANTTVITGITSTSQSITDLSIGTTYYFKVRAIGNGGTGAYSPTISETTMAESNLLLVPDGISQSNVRVVRGDGRQVLSFFAYGLPAKMESVFADLNGDGEQEIVVSAVHANATPHVRVFDARGMLLSNLFPYNPEHQLRGGASITAGDFNHDGVDELAVIPFGSRSHLLIYSFRDSFEEPTIYAQTGIYDPGFMAGSELAVGDVNGDDREDLIIWTNQRSPNIQVYSLLSGTLERIGFVFPYPHRLPDGANLASADFDGNGSDEIAVIPNGHGTANIQIYTHDLSYQGSEETIRRDLRRLVWTIGYVEEMHGGFHIATGDIDGDERAELVVAPRRGRGGHVQTFRFFEETNSLEIAHGFFPYGENFFGGVNVHLADTDGDGSDELITTTEDGSHPNTRIYSFVDRDDIGWNVDAWFWAFPEDARIGTDVSS